VSVKKIIFSVCFIFTLIVGDVVGQNKVDLPWMFYPQQSSFMNTSYCTKYGCDNWQNKKKGFVTNGHNLFNSHGGGYKGNFDKIRSAFYEISTLRYVIFPNNKFGVLNVELIMDSSVRYGEVIANELRRGILDPRMYELVNEFMFSMVGKRYSKQQIIDCYKYRGGNRIFDEFRVPKNTPVSQLPALQSGPGEPQIFVSISCNGAVLESLLFQIQLSGLAVLDGLVLPQ
jgi:hypothetical protein